MKLQNKIWIMLFALGTMLGGCDFLIYENMSDCPQGVYVGFYSMTPCAADSTFIGEVSDLHLFTFNDKNLLVSLSHQKNVSLDKQYKLFVPVTAGYYSFIGWTGVNDKFVTGSFKPGVTSKKDVMLTLASKNKQAELLGNHRVWQGESSSVLVRNPAEFGSDYKYTYLNLRQITHRVNVEIELHDSILKNTKPEDYEIEIASAGGTVLIDGSMPLKQEALSFPATVSYSANSLKAQFSLMDLKTGYKNLLTLRNKKNNEVIWEGDLLGSILLKNTNVNLECQNDFDMKFVIKDKCLNCGTFICWAIYVNDWLIHSYETVLGLNP